MAEEGSTRKSRNKEFEEVHLCTTLNDYVAIGVKKTVRWTVFREGVKDTIVGNSVSSLYIIYRLFL